MKKNSVITSLLIIIMCTSIFATILPQAFAGKPQRNPEITIELQVKNGMGVFVDADTEATEPDLLSGPVAFQVIVTNTGDVALSKISITDTASGTTTAFRAK